MQPHIPPSIWMVAPVTYDAFSLARNTATDASSSGRPSLPIGIAAIWAAQIGATDQIKSLRTAATCLEIMASDEAYTLKVVKLLDLTTNGPATAAELRARAAKLAAQADDLESASVADFDWAEWVVNDFSGRERLDAEALRDG